MESRTLASITLASLLALDACIGTDDPKAEVDGYWAGRLTPPGSRQSEPVEALIEQDGPALLYDELGIVYRMSSLDGSASFQGDIQPIAPIGYAFKTEAADPGYQVNGVAEDYLITANLSGVDGKGDLELMALRKTIPGNAVDHGNWSGYYVSPSPFPVSLQMGPDGAFDGHDAFGCRLTGHMRQHQVHEDLFDVEITSAGPAPFCGKRYQGLGYAADYDTFGYFRHKPGHYYYIGVFNEESAFVAEFLVD